MELGTHRYHSLQGLAGDMEILKRKLRLEIHMWSCGDTKSLAVIMCKTLNIIYIHKEMSKNVQACL